MGIQSLLGPLNIITQVLLDFFLLEPKWVYNLTLENYYNPSFQGNKKNTYKLLEA